MKNRQVFTPQKPYIVVPIPIEEPLIVSLLDSEEVSKWLTSSLSNNTDTLKCFDLLDNLVLNTLNIVDDTVSSVSFLNCDEVYDYNANEQFNTTIQYLYTATSNRFLNELFVKEISYIYFYLRGVLRSFGIESPGEVLILDDLVEIHL